MTDIQTGAGLLWLDICLVLLSALAAGIQYWRIATWRSGWLISTARWMIALGWTLLSARVAEQLITKGDILISLPSLISLVFVSSGSILVNVFWSPRKDHAR